MENAYAAIGRAVAFAQIFETVLIPIFEVFKIHTELGYLEKTGGALSVGAFKIPVTNIIKALSKKGNIAPDLEDRLTQYIEDRHRLIHRWVKENGWPEDNDAAGFAPIIELANRVEREAKELTRLFTGYIVQFAEPEWAAANADAYREKMAAIFTHAHIKED